MWLPHFLKTKKRLQREYEEAAIVEQLELGVSLIYSGDLFLTGLRIFLEANSDARKMKVRHYVDPVFHDTTSYNFIVDCFNRKLTPDRWEAAILVWYLDTNKGTKLEAAQKYFLMGDRIGNKYNDFLASTDGYKFMQLCAYRYYEDRPLQVDMLLWRVGRFWKSLQRR